MRKKLRICMAREERSRGVEELPGRIPRLPLLSRQRKEMQMSTKKAKKRKNTEIQKLCHFRRNGADIRCGQNEVSPLQSRVPSFPSFLGLLGMTPFPAHASHLLTRRRLQGLLAYQRERSWWWVAPVNCFTLTYI